MAFWAVPDEIRLHPRALSAYRRASGRTPADAPLVEAPGFMAPPRDRRGCPCTMSPDTRASSRARGSLVHTTFSLAGLRPARGRSTAA